LLALIGPDMEDAPTVTEIVAEIAANRLIERGMNAVTRFRNAAAYHEMSYLVPLRPHCARIRIC
jgi:hypothetical protein